MKKSILILCSMIAGLITMAQTYNLTLGDEIKLKKGTADLDVITADNTGLYFSSARMRRGIGSIPGLDYKLVKLDKNFSEVYDKEYKKELKGLEFESFQTLGDDIYLFASDYIKKEKLFKVYGARVDKNSGDLMGDFTELGDYLLENKKDDYDMKVTSIRNGTAFLMVSNISGKDRVTLGVHLLDKSLKRKESAIINLSFIPGNYSLQDVQFTKNNKIIILGKEFEETLVGKKKRKRMAFKQYVMSIYNAKGKKEKDVTIDANDRYIISGRLIEQPGGEMLLAGFYSNNANREGLNGFYINKVDTDKGSILLSSFKEINTGMLGNYFMDDTDDDDQSKEEKKQAKKAKDDDVEEEFPNEFVIKAVTTNPADNSIIITSEASRYSVSTYQTSSYNKDTRSVSYKIYYVHRFIRNDILIINADKDGNINWLNVLPKSQVEEVRSTSSVTGGFSFHYDQAGYFAGAGGMPFYSSFSSLLNGNSLVVIMNDHTSNNVNPGYGDKVKTVYNFRKRSSVYGINIDLATGKMTRKIIGSNNDETILMPRHAYIVKNELFIPSWRLHMLAKTELKFAKITVK